MADSWSSLVSTSGFALRQNGSCPDTDKDCGQTVAPFHACCPRGSFCPTQYNVNCCPSADNCTESLLPKPKCANETWNLYDNEGYFCCEPGSTGYKTPGNSDGCALPGYSFDEEETLLSIISSGKAVPTSTSSSSSRQSTTPASRSVGSITATASVEPAASSKTDTGAIAGGVVGGVAGLVLIIGLIWFFIRRRSRRPVDEQHVPVPETVKGSYTPMVELEGRSRATELESPFPELESQPNQPNQPLYELASDQPIQTKGATRFT